MTISVLTDNHAGSFCQAEHGLSYLIDFDGKKLLFDTGQSDLFLRNAGIMGVNPEDADMIILSHGHFDHGNGLGHPGGGKLICHPGCFSARFRKHDHTYIGLKYTSDELSSRFSLQTSDGPFTITENIIFLGEIPRLTDFESISTPFALDNGTPDYVADDRSEPEILWTSDIKKSYLTLTVNGVMPFLLWLIGDRRSPQMPSPPVCYSG